MHHERDCTHDYQHHDGYRIEQNSYVDMQIIIESAAM